MGLLDTDSEKGEYYLQTNAKAPFNRNSLGMTYEFILSVY